jgi:hypothetical protein
MGLSQIGGATYTRLVTKQNAAGDTVLSTTASSPGSGTYSSWGQLTASTPAEYVITAIALHTASAISSTAFDPISVQVGYGGAGAETALGTRNVVLDYVATSNYGSVASVELAVPWRVASGVRLAARLAANNSTGATSWDVYVSVVPWASLEGN